jgi:hypothetical protein
MRFTKDNQLAIVSRLWYTDDTGYKKSWYTPTWKEYMWHLKALTIKDGIELSNFGKEYQFNTNLWADIKESDKLTIDWVEYNVKGIWSFNWITFNRLMCILQKW